MKKYFISLGRIIGIIVATRLIASLLIAGSFGTMSVGLSMVLVLIAPLLYLIGAAYFLTVFGLPLFFCRSAKDFVAVTVTYVALFGMSEVGARLYKAHLAGEYATPSLATPSKRHDTAVFFSDQCIWAPHYTKFKYITCVSDHMMTRTEAAPSSECERRKIEVQGKPCYVPVPSVPVTDALVMYEVDGNRAALGRMPTPLALKEAFTMPKNSRGLVLTEVADGKETVLGRSFLFSGGSSEFFIDLFFGYPEFFGLQSWQNVTIVPPGMSDTGDPKILQTLQERVGTR